MLHDLLVLIGILVAILFTEPHFEGIDDLSDVVRIESKVEVTDFAAFIIEVWLIDKMPSFLVGTSLEFDVISEGSAFSEWMLTLLVGP